MIRLQRCADCGRAQYPPREVCGTCLSEMLHWDSADFLPGRVLARTVLHHSNEPAMRPHLPLTIGLVQFDAGPVAVCLLADTILPGHAVQVRLNADALLEAV
ncbi:MAG TPA: zinc ribbon domain-containing protein [Acetobacteraceae bacterium]|nr:zinc ribbon domain-containing protein [Acetobacteraceae bacterium]